MKEIKNEKAVAGVKIFLSRTKILDPISHKAMTVFPLATESLVCFDYLTLDEAIEKGKIEVTESSEGGSVPDLLVKNKGTKPVLMMTGEEVVGAKQNRTLNTDILIKGKSEVVIPVSCTESGRWHPTTKKMETAKFASPPRTRARIGETVFRSLSSGLGHFSNQSQVWASLSGYQAEHHVDSPTGAIKDVYDSKETDLQEYVDNLKPDKDTWNGMAVVIGSRFVGIDIFDSSKTMSKLWDKLIRSYALDALNVPKSTALNRKEIQKILDLVKEAPMKVFPSISLGYDVRIDTEKITGSALVRLKNRIYGVIHLSLFGKENPESSRPQTQEMRSSRERSQTSSQWTRSRE